MGKKAYSYWRGRPNPPPLNWITPNRPAIRKVAGSFDDLLPASSLQVDDKQSDIGAVAVSLTNSHWLCVLKALHRYGQMHGDEDWKKWRMEVRKAILGVVNPNRDEKQPVAVKLDIENWRTIWLQVRTGCQELGDDWIRWFDWLSHTMAEQIKGRWAEVT